MNSAELEKLLRKRGAVFRPKKGKGGHVEVELNGRRTTLPRHGSRQEISKGTLNSVFKKLGLK